jgi:hypothetical protein
MMALRRSATVAVVGGIEGVVEPWPRQVVFADEPEHAGFELAAGELGVGCDCVGESPGASVPVGSRDDVFDRSVVVELQAFGLREGSLEVVLGDVRGDVEERAEDRRGRDALVVCGVLGIEGPRTVQADPRDPAPGRRGGHLRARRVVLQEVPVHRGADVTEHRALPARQHRRQPPPLPRHRRATHGVHAAMDPPQASPLHPARHTGAPDAQRAQLRQRHHTPLPPSELSYSNVGGYAV